jgi:hypothetical protein
MRGGSLPKSGITPHNRFHPFYHYNRGIPVMYFGNARLLKAARRNPDKGILEKEMDEFN